MPSRISAALSAMLVVAALALTGCVMAPTDDHGGMGMDHSTSSEFSAADIMFAQMMIPHHEQAVDLAKLALDASDDPAILELASQIEQAQEPEIALMKSWLDDAGAPQMVDHDMGMGGMLTDDELDAIRSATGAEFDRLFLDGMIAHHDGAIDMAKTVVDSDNADVKALAEGIIETQTAEIATMRALLAR